MSRLDSLPPDLRATLSLLLRQRKRHAEVAALLGIEERAVHDRAHAALALLAPRQARALSAEQRERLGEYLLGQQDPAAARETRAELEDSAGGRAWAQALAAELAPLAAQPLPEIPAGRAASAPARTQPDPATAVAAPAHAAADRPAAAGEPPAPAVASAPTPQARSSRVGGAVVLGVLAAIVVVVVLLVVGVGGGGSHAGKQPSASAGDTTSSASKPATGTSTGAATSTTASGDTSTAAGAGTPASGSQTSHGKALELTPPDPATSKAVGVAYVLTQKSERAFYLFAKDLPVLPTGSFYAVWLEGSSKAVAYPLGSLPAQGSNGLVEGGGPLPKDASSYTRIIVTTETSDHPAHPGPTALGGAFTVG